MGSVIVENNIISFNEACCFGTMPDSGGLVASGSSVVRGNLIIGNYSDDWIGGVAVGTNTIFEDNLVLDNAARIDVGGVFAGGTVRNNIIAGNTCAIWGGGVMALPGSVVVGNTIIDNSTHVVGGGVYAWGGATVMGNRIVGNVAAGDPYGWAGGVYGEDDAMVVGNTIVGNAAFVDGGGVYVASLQDDPTVLGNIIAFSTAGGGLYIGPEVENPVYDYNCVFGNAGGDYSPHTPPGVHDINVDPRFVDLEGPDGLIGTEDDNLRLAPDSPCIDAGDPDFAPEPGDTDLDGHARVLCGRVDMGAYEFGIGDYECDRDVDLFDLANWADCLTGPANPPYPDGCEAFDFNGDLDVDLEDFGAIQLAFTGG